MMANTDKELQYLLRQYFDSRITEAEYHELWKLLQTEDRKNTLSDELQLLWEYAEENKPVIPATTWNEKMKRLLDETNTTSSGPGIGKRSVWRSYKWYAAAAVTVLIVAAGIYFYLAAPSHNKADIARHVPAKDILPGGNKAVLTLANGSTLVLDSNVRGIIFRQGNTKIIKPANGKITYSQVNTAPNDVVYNTLSTPRGGQYQITLPDGTNVWLNSASSLRFPTSFTGDKRIVEMTGEAYFEVKENATKPFVVTVDGMQVKVLGTHFNIMAYDDEPVIKTTLLSGAISVRKENVATLLSPGQQAQVTKEGKIQVVKDVNINKAVAWKNNLFWFDKNTIQEVMRQVARWYNVDVVISGTIMRHFTGSIPRDVKVSKVFEVLQETGSVHFTIENNKIIVSP
jgi:ferric-dicitrate binding protein FerR (iron transport regulator)